MTLVKVASIIACLAGVLNIILGIGIYRKAVKNIANRLFVVLVFVTAVWAWVNSFYLSHIQYPYVNLVYSIGAWVPFFILIWVIHFTNHALKKLYIAIGGILTAAISIVTLIPNIFIRERMEYYSNGYGTIPGQLFWVFAVYMSTLAIVAFMIFYKRWRATDGLQRVQYNYIFFGIVFPTSIILIFDFILPIFNIYSLATFDSTLSLVFVAVTGYSITRYRFLDIKLVIKKGLFSFSHYLFFCLFTYTY